MLAGEHRRLTIAFRLIEAGEPLTPEPRLESGTLVEITRGSLAGTHGKVLRQGKQWKFMVEVEFLQRGRLGRRPHYYHVDWPVRARTAVPASFRRSCRRERS